MLINVEDPRDWTYLRNFKEKKTLTWSLEFIFKLSCWNFECFQNNKIFSIFFHKFWFFEFFCWNFWKKIQTILLVSKLVAKVLWYWIVTIMHPWKATKQCDEIDEINLHKSRGWNTEPIIEFHFWNFFFKSISGELIIFLFLVINTCMTKQIITRIFKQHT